MAQQETDRWRWRLKTANPENCNLHILKLLKCSFGVVDWWGSRHRRQVGISEMIQRVLFRQKISTPSAISRPPPWHNRARYRGAPTFGKPNSSDLVRQNSSYVLNDGPKHFETLKSPLNVPPVCSMWNAGVEIGCRPAV